MILYRSFHNLNLDSEQIDRKVIPTDFDEFIKDYITFAMNNGSTKLYSVHDNNTTVVSCIRSIAVARLSVDEIDDEMKTVLDSYSESIADKLLREEMSAQGKIYGTGKKVKKGSLVQALILENDSYLYVIAKVEHQGWYDGDSLKKNFGFPSDKKNVWKSAVFSLVIDGEQVGFDAVKIYTDNEAKYWAISFLELDETRTDEKNTEIVFDAVEHALKRKVKPESERDYYLLRNALIKTLKTAQRINYPDFVESLIGGYRPEKDDLDLRPVRAVLSELPEKKGFDRQFNTVPEMIKKRRKLNFPIMQGIEISLTGEVNNFKESVVAFEDETGTRYIRIICSDSRTYQIFKPSGE